jgi:hypothetical protein
MSFLKESPFEVGGRGSSAVPISSEKRGVQRKKVPKQKVKKKNFFILELGSEL